MVSSVSLVGLGKLGAPMAACIAARGIRVKAVDLNPQKVDCINRKVAPVHEPGLEELIREAGDFWRRPRTPRRRCTIRRLRL